MIQSIKERLESMFSDLKSTLDGQESMLESLEVDFSKLISEFNSEAIAYCLKKYIESELDYTTLGSRGIGRMTDNIPRFGAYFRKPLSILSNQELNKLYYLMQDLCIRGYLNSALYIKWREISSKLSDKDLLFKEWIPSIYVINPYEFSPEIWDITKINIALTKIEIYEFMRKHQIIRNTIFKRVSEDRVSGILEYYAVAGYSLRAVEEGFY